MRAASGSFATAHPANSQHGLFFAIMVPHNESAQLTACFQAFRRIYPFQCTPITPDRLHLSLHAVYRGTELPDEEIQTAVMAGDMIQTKPFAITFRSALTCPSPKSKAPFVLSTDESPEALDRLCFKIGSAHSMMSWDQDYRPRLISPHVTLAWDRIVVPRTPIAPITMTAREFALVCSYIGLSEYDIVKRWPLID